MRDLEARLDILPVSTGIGEARRFTKNQLQVWGQVDLVDTAILLISELVTNAILHGGEGAILTLLLNDRTLRVEVQDASPALPVVRSYSETATTGRGMVIVDSLSAAWGSFPVAGGKVVWFELATVEVEPEGSSQGQKPARAPETPRMVSEFKGLSVSHGAPGSRFPSGRVPMPVGLAGRAR